MSILSMNNNGIRKYIGISYIYTIVQILYNFITLPIKVGYLGENLYGTYMIVCSLFGYFIMMGRGFGTTVVRYIAHYKTTGEEEKSQQFINLSLIISLISCFLTIILGLIFKASINNFFNITPQHQDITVAILIALLVQACFVFLLSIFPNIIQGNSRFNIYKIGLSISLVLKFISLVALVSLRKSIIIITWVEISMHIILLLYFLVYCVRKLGFKFEFNVQIPREFICEILKYTFIVNIGVIVDIVYWKTDPILLGRLSDTVTITHYSISSSIVIAYMSASSAFASVFLPKVTKLVSSGKSDGFINCFFERSSRYQFFIVGFILFAFITLGKEFIYFWMGEGFNDTFIYALIIMIPITIPLVQNIGIQILYAKKKHTVRSVIYLVIAFINILISIVLIKQIGALGAAIGTATAMIIGQVIAINIYYSKVLLLRVFEFFRVVLLKTFIALLISAGIITIINTFIPSYNLFFLMVKFLLFVLVYCVALYIIVLTKKEKNIVLDRIKHILRI